jgi:hypothetical protein
LLRYEKFDDHKPLILYFFNNFLKEKATWRSSIKYFEFMKQSESAQFIRTNNACEGYNNRLRIQLKYCHSPIGYVIKKLIDEEAGYRNETLAILTRKKSKYSAPGHMKDLNINMPLCQFLNDFIKIFKYNKELLMILNNEKATLNDLEKYIKIDKAQDLVDEIIRNIFEEDVLEEDYEEKEEHVRKYFFKF